MPNVDLYGNWKLIYINMLICVFIYFQSYNDVVYCKLNRPNEQTQWKFTV